MLSHPRGQGLYWHTAKATQHNSNKPNSESGNLERRLHTRHRARTTVYITLPGSGRRLCRAVNLSATGVFIQTTNLGLRKGQNVELVFAINLGAVTKLHRRTAVVAHVSRGGTGLMMESYSSVSTATAARAG
jgi:hypothetical protein